MLVTSHCSDPSAMWLVPHAGVHFLRATPSFNVLAPTHWPEQYGARFLGMCRLLSGTNLFSRRPAVGSFPGRRYQVPAWGWLAIALIALLPFSGGSVPAFTQTHSVRYLGRLLARRLPTHGACNSLAKPLGTPSPKSSGNLGDASVLVLLASGHWYAWLVMVLNQPTGSIRGSYR